MIRHGNFVETVPIALILLGIVEIQEFAPPIIQAALSVLLVVSRIAHAYAFLYLHKPNVHLFYRAPGMIGTITVIIICSLIALIGGVIV